MYEPQETEQLSSSVVGSPMVLISDDVIYATSGPACAILPVPVFSPSSSRVFVFIIFHYYMLLPEHRAAVTDGRTVRYFKRPNARFSTEILCPDEFARAPRVTRERSVIIINDRYTSYNTTLLRCCISDEKWYTQPFLFMHYAAFRLFGYGCVHACVSVPVSVSVFCFHFNELSLLFDSIIYYKILIHRSVRPPLGSLILTGRPKILHNQIISA